MARLKHNAAYSLRGDLGAGLHGCLRGSVSSNLCGRLYGRLCGRLCGRLSEHLLGRLRVGLGDGLRRGRLPFRHLALRQLIGEDFGDVTPDHHFLGDAGGLLLHSALAARCVDIHRHSTRAVDDLAGRQIPHRQDEMRG